MKLKDYQEAEILPAMLLFNKRLTPEDREEVREITLQVDDPNLQVEPGQSIGVIAPGTQEFGHAEHYRLYTVADLPNHSTPDITVVSLCVKRCNYIDEFSGERVHGIASNYLCDLQPGDQLRVNGPFGVPFTTPDNSDDLVLICAGTGIAPFRAFIKKLYREGGDRTGKVWLFHGAMTGLEMLYANEEDDDLTQYYDRETFSAFEALSPRPSFADEIAMDYALEERAAQIWEMLQGPGTRVYVAGQEKILGALNRIFQIEAGSAEAWTDFKARLIAEGRWQELMY
ncbi:MAG: ferredoxin--NADP+ reductase [Kiritimatiellia bacterium]|jgi:ferredoxin--NADP+ reductase